MGAKVTFDTNNRLMIVTEAPVINDGAVVAQQTLDIEIDFYSDAKEDWRLNATGKFRGNVFPFVTAESAGALLPGGQVEPAFFRLRNDQGWRILPYDTDHELTILGNVVPVDSSLPIMAPRAGRTILIFRDGSQVAQMTDTTVAAAVDNTPKLVELHGQVERSVWINTEETVNGNGFQHTPYNNWTDAVDYAEANGLRKLVVLADATIDRQLKNFIIIGVGTPVIDCNGQNLDKSEISRCTVTGPYSGRVVMQECSLKATTSLNGFFENCAMGLNFIVPDDGIAFVKNCSSFASDTSFDVGGATGTGELVLVGWDGAMTILNVNQATDSVQIASNTSRTTLDSTCTQGAINLDGLMHVVNNANGAVVTGEPLDPHYLHEVWQRLDLDKDNPMVHSDTQIVGGLLNILISDNGDGTFTAARQ